MSLEGIWFVQSYRGVDVNRIERRGEGEKKSPKIMIHWDHSGISCPYCPTHHTNTHKHPPFSILQLLLAHWKHDGILSSSISFG